LSIETACPKKFTRSRKAQLRRVRGRNRRELALDLEPYRHGIDPREVSRDAGDEQLDPVLGLDERAESVRDLEASLVVDARWMIAPKHRSLVP
jgi:hypothetical protein